MNNDNVTSFTGMYQLCNFVLYGNDEISLLEYFNCSLTKLLDVYISKWPLSDEQCILVLFSSA